MPRYWGIFRYLTIYKKKFMSLPVKDTLIDFIDTYIAAYEEQKQEMVIPFDPDWDSPCYRESGSPGDWVNWAPVIRQDSHDFSELENALGIELNTQLKDFFSACWSDNLNARTERGNLQLLLPWNEEDFVRLQQNLVGHVLMKRRLGQDETFFFAVTDEEDFNLCIDAKTGEVVLEQVGLPPQEVLADDLSGFLKTLKPLVR